MRQMRDSVVFLIDCHKPMHQRNKHNENDESNIKQVMQSVTSFLKTKVITSDQDKIGIVLFGCKTQRNSMNYQNIHVLMPLDCPDAQSIKNIEGIADTVTKDFGFSQSETNTPLFEALWTCHQEFKSVEKLAFNKRIFLFTCEDNPGNAEDKA